MIDTQLKDKVVLVTRANHGIGAATAKAFVAEGAAVAIHYLSATCRRSGWNLQAPARDERQSRG